jgi:hypothetical protein
MLAEGPVFFVMIPTPGEERQWPEDGMPLIKTRAMDELAFGWVYCDFPEEAVAKFLEMDDHYGGDVRLRAVGPAQVIELRGPDVIKVPL